MDELAPIRLDCLADFVLGEARCRPALRRIEWGGAYVSLEPRMMQVLALLAAHEGEAVSRRELFSRCWADAAVGDDSLNRVVAGLRKVANGACAGCWSIETVTGHGYVLRVRQRPAASRALWPGDYEAAMEAAWTAWRVDSAIVPEAEIAALRQLAADHPRDARVLAMLAYMLRLGAEYCELPRCGDLVLECERAAERSLRIDPGNDVARTALLTLRPIYGDWTARRQGLTKLFIQAPESAVAAHELAILEMATGRIAAARELVERLLERDPRAPALLYKRIYHLWSVGELGEMDRVADAAVQLWPQHMGIGMARFWSFLGTGRAGQAERHLAELAGGCRLPPPAIAVMQQTAATLARPEAADAWRQAVAMNMAAASRGPAQAVAAMIHLAMLGAVEEAFAVAEGYYLRRGGVEVGLARSESDLPIPDQSRRVTQPLFIPATAAMRTDPRFESLVEEIGLAEHWRKAGVEPDHLAAGSDC